MLRMIVPVLGLAAACLAGSPTVGEAAPELGGANWVMNDPGEVDLSALRGEVIFIEKWGVKCGPCLALIPHVEDLQEEYGERGLHIFAFEAQNHTPAQIEETVLARGGGSYAVSAGGAGNYRTDGGIPHGWLIGVEGTVIWEGNPGSGDFDRTLRAELEKVRFPGLGRLEFHPDVMKPVASFLEKDYADARKQARKILDKSDDEAVLADATYLLEKIDSLAAAKVALAQSEVYAFLKATFKKDDEGILAKDRLKVFKRDDAIEREIEAAETLSSVLEQLRGQPEEQRQAVLRKFAEKFEGTRAAEEALR